MPVVSHVVLRKFVYEIYRGAGGTEEDARIVSDHVVDSNLAGHDSCYQRAKLHWWYGRWTSNRQDGDC